MKNYFLNEAIIKRNIKIMNISVNPIQIGDKTHNQLQLITLVNFKTTNAIVSSPVNPIPLD